MIVEGLLCCQDGQSKACRMNGDDVRYLRDKALQFRQLALSHQTDLTDALLRLADEFDAKAAEIAARPGQAPG
jgi:hypothetical protein